MDWEAFAQEKGLRRFFKISRALFWAMLMKLSPARRVFLLIALALSAHAILTTRVVINQDKVPVAIPGNSGEMLVAVAALVFLLALELADRVTMKRDLEIAREIQRWLVPDTPPRVPGIDLAFSSQPANTVGGDYYDAFPLDPERPPGKDNPVLLVVADVAGKSVPAALLMATFQASRRSLSTASVSLEELVAGMNRYACAHSLGGRRFTTAFFAELDPLSRALAYISAGHNPPLLRRASGQLERLEAGNLPLGIDLATKYEQGSAKLAPGDELIIFTDGLIETQNVSEEEFGEERLVEFLKAAPAESAQKTLERLVASVDAFAGHARQYDDLTCLILRTP